MSRNSNIGLSRKQKVFATLESVVGTLVFPNATTDYIHPAGNAIMNQSPSFSNSEELADTLDILDQFQNAMPAGDWTIKMYVRPAGLGNSPQGSALFEALQGYLNADMAAMTLGTTVNATISTANILGGSYLPNVGAITIGTEKMSYTGKSTTGATTQLTGIVRGYGSTTATIHTATASVTFAGKYYRQGTTSKSFSLWIETDHFVQAMSGCAVNSATLSVTNDGGLMMTFTGGGMQMKWAGTSTLSTRAATTATTVTVANAKLFCAGMYVYNQTKSTGKFLINGSNATTNVLRLGSALGAQWATSDTIKGYLPTGTEIGEPIEAKNSAAYLNGTLTKIKKCDLNIGVPKQFLTDEVGTTYPEDFLENVRDISTALNIYFRKSDAQNFKDGYAGNEVPVKLTFGNAAGYYMIAYMKRAKLNVPTINFAPPAIELNIPVKALGTNGEDSLELVMI